MSIGDTSVGIAGAGPVAQAFGIALQDCGIPIDCIASRNLQHAKAAAKRLGDSVRAVIYPDLSLRVSHVIIAVTDQAITPVAELLASPNAKLGIALHTCGTYGPELLNPLNAIGVSCGTIHPLQTLMKCAHLTRPYMFVTSYIKIKVVFYSHHFSQTVLDGPLTLQEQYNILL